MSCASQYCRQGIRSPSKLTVSSLARSFFECMSAAVAAAAERQQALVFAAPAHPQRKSRFEAMHAMASCMERQGCCRLRSCWFTSLFANFLPRQGVLRVQTNFCELGQLQVPLAARLLTSPSEAALRSLSLSDLWQNLENSLVDPAGYRGSCAKRQANLCQR